MPQTIVIRNRDCENEVNSRKLAVLKKGIFRKSSSWENVCLAIYDATLSNNRYTRKNALKLHLTGAEFT